MNNRNSIFPGKQSRNNSQFSAKIDRTTSNPIHNSLTKPSMSKQAQSEKNIQMAQKIMMVVNRHYNNSQSHLRVITKQMLINGGSNVFYDVFASLAKAIDQKFDRSDINVDIVLDILKVFNYPGNLNKNIFQPIGAPHTWYNCLGILDFMAEITFFATSFRHYTQESMNSGQNSGDQTQFLMKAVLSNDPQILINKLKDEIIKMQNSCFEYRSRAAKTQLFIKNLTNQQKSLVEMDQQIRKQQQLINSIQQEILSQEYQKQQLNKQSINLKKNIQEQENTLKILQEQVTKLQDKLKNIEVSAEEGIKLEQQIRQGQLLYEQLQKKLNLQVQNLRNILSNTINQLRQYLIKGQLSFAQINRQSSVAKFSNYKSSSQTIEQLSLFIDRILYREQILTSNISTDINRIFTSFPWSSMNEKAEIAIDQTKRKGVDYKLNNQSLRNKTHELTLKSMRLKKSLEQLTRRKKTKQNLVLGKQQKNNNLKFKLDSLKQKKASLQCEKKRLSKQIQKMQNQENQLMIQIQQTKKISSLLKKQSISNKNLNLIKFQTMKKSVAQLIVNHKSRVRKTFELCLQDPQLQEYIDQQFNKEKIQEHP